MAKSLEQLFWQYAQGGAKLHDCWSWSGELNGQGYARIVHREKGVRTRVLAHRFSFELHCRALAHGEQVLHRCDNPPCCNPLHLFAGTQRDNMLDKVEKGRHVPNGSFTFKTSKEQREQIRKLVASGMTQTAVGKQFGISQARVWKIVNS